jgi:hypothetical protein
VNDPRPWWASELDAEAVGSTVDPLEAHRAARRGGPPPRDDTSWWDLDGLREPAPDAASSGATTGTAGTDDATGTAGTDDATGIGGAAGAGHGPDVCGACPICLALRSLGESRPQLLEHLTEAARHLAAAVRSVVEEPPRGRGDDARRGGGADPFERIDLD